MHGFTLKSMKCLSTCKKIHIIYAPNSLTCNWKKYLIDCEKNAWVFIFLPSALKAAHKNFIYKYIYIYVEIETPMLPLGIHLKQVVTVLHIFIQFLQWKSGYSVTLIYILLDRVCFKYTKQNIRCTIRPFLY